jgi:hypothetical protein
MIKACALTRIAALSHKKAQKAQVVQKRSLDTRLRISIYTVRSILMFTSKSVFPEVNMFLTRVSLFQTREPHSRKQNNISELQI